MHTVHILIRLVEHHQILAYGLIFLGVALEGEVTLISAGVLIHLGALNFWNILIFVYMAGMTQTFLGYSLGIFFHKKFNNNNFFVYVEKRVLSVAPRFNQKPFWSIFISKFIMINHLVIIFSGYKKIALRKFLKAEIISTTIWAPLLLSLGYFFSYTALHISREISRFLLIVIIFTIGFLVIDKLIGFLYELFEYSKNGDDKKIQ